MFPVRRDELFAYDVMILGDVNPALAQRRELAEPGRFCRSTRPRRRDDLHRRAEVHAAGLSRYAAGAAAAAATSAACASPTRRKPLTEGFRVEPTELGLASPAMQLGDTPEETRAIWQGLPQLYWMIEAAQWKPAVRVLAELSRRRAGGRPRAVIVLQYVGAGKVLFHATDETWRWRRRVGDVYFARYWIQTIRYLSRSKLAAGQHSAELTTDRREYRPGEAGAAARPVHRRAAGAGRGQRRRGCLGASGPQDPARATASRARRAAGYLRAY